MPDNASDDFLHIDSDAAMCLEQITSSKSYLNAIIRKYAAVLSALEAVDELPSEGQEIDEGSFGYTALPLPSFLELMFELVDCLANDREFRSSDGGHLPVTLLDAGCGTGRNVHLLATGADFKRFDSRGIESVQEYMHHGLRVYDLHGKLEHADCMEYDYSPFDIVYFYRPFSDDALQNAFEERLVSSLSQGAYIAAPLSVGLDANHRLTVRGSTGQIWKKLK